MGAAIGQSLPVAVGILLSPMPIVAVVLMLVTPRARSNSVAFVLAWLVGLFVAGAVVLLVVGAASTEAGPTPTWLSWVRNGGGAEPAASPLGRGLRPTGA